MNREAASLIVIPANAGIQRLLNERHWVPAFAGTKGRGNDRYGVLTSNIFVMLLRSSRRNGVRAVSPNDG
jgi:hypothetical protein